MALVELLAGSPGGRRRLQLKSPATLEPCGEIDVATADDVRAAVECARKAQPAWAEAGCDERARHLRRAVRVLLANEDEYAATIARETGKPELEVLATAIVTA